MSYMAIGFGLSLSCASAISCYAGDPIGTDELLSALVLRETRLNGKRLVFDYTLYVGQEETEPPTDQQEFLSHFGQAVRASVVFDGYKYEQVRTTTDAAGKLVYAIGITETLTWNGIEARGTYRRREDPLLRVELRSTPNLAHHIEPYMTWLGWVRDSADSKMPLSDFVRGFAPEDVERTSDDGHVTEWFFPIDPPGGMTIRATRSNGQVLLHSLEFQQYRNEGEGFEIRGFERFTFEETPDGMPHSARVEKAVGFGGGPEAQFWNVVDMEIQDVEENAESDFLATIEPPFSVTDLRYSLAYESGESRVSVDGRWLYTHEPIMVADVGDRLDWWVERGEWEELYRPTTHDAPTQDGGSVNLVAILAFGIGGLLLIIAVWKPRRTEGA